jgi:hypothetical protein
LFNMTPNAPTNPSNTHQHALTVAFFWEEYLSRLWL